MLHVRLMPKRSEGNPDLRGDLVELCLRGGLLDRCAPSLTMSHIVKECVTYEYINMDNIQLV